MRQSKPLEQVVARVVALQVVADEVRKLATQASRSATTTADVVGNVLSSVQETRDRLARLAEASSDVREIAESAAVALKEVAGATAESSAWSVEISNAAGDVKKLVEESTRRLQTIAEGTEAVVASIARDRRSCSGANEDNG